jgi:hypothetical protein
MPTLYQRSVALFLSFVIAFQALACAWSPYMEYDMLFDRDLVFEHGKHNTSYNAWYYNQELYNSDNLRFQNADSWVTFLEHAYRREDIISFIYRGEAKYNVQEKELLQLRKTRLKALQAPLKESQFVACIVFALKVEQLLEHYKSDPWDDEPIQIQMSDFTPLINEATAQIKANTDVFIKERYAFQLLKLYRYSKQYNPFILNFKKYFETKKSMLSYWAMEHYAGILSELGKTAQANYYFAKVYVNCSAKRSSSYLSMKLSAPANFEQTLALCTSDEEQMALHYIHAMQTKALALQDLKEITSKLGNHEYARVVMSHEINKLEKILLNRAQTEEDFAYQSERMSELKLLQNQVGAYLKDLIQLNQSLVSQDKNDAFWHLSLAYLYHLDQQFDACSEVLKTIKPTTPEIQKQHDIIFIVNYLAQRKTLSEADENIIGEKLMSLNQNNPSYPFLGGEDYPMGKYTNERFLVEEYNTLNQYIFTKIAERYKNLNAFMAVIFSGNQFESDLCIKSAISRYEDLRTPNFIIKLTDIDRILTDLKRTPENKLSTFAASYYFGTPQYVEAEDTYHTPLVAFELCAQKLLELKATILLRDPAQIEQALQILEGLPKELTDQHYTYGSPFLYSAKTPHFGYQYQHQNRLPKLTRLAFARQVKSLADQTNSATSAFQLGVAYYNASYYGLQWDLLAYYRWFSYPNGNVDMRIAEKYLNMALNLGGLNTEQQAQTYFMLARCEQNRYTLQNGAFRESYDGDRAFFIDFNRMKRSLYMQNFEILARNYKATASYKEIIKECKYFTYYLN